jgi:hypothetical protein
MMNSKHITEKTLEFVTALQHASMDDLWEAVHALEDQCAHPAPIRQRALLVLEELANDRELADRAAFMKKRIEDDLSCHGPSCKTLMGLANGIANDR